ncbi:hypothetical protein JTE90_015667 [Oedothorax gibbosus]|uniref:Myelin regulatory factor n=1 Tax=Oedothorax gibbosus TaxID=931172 RepID=A0AAV6UG02_9ARAC|nr:hypothetical protein JTE90_015667 [Oedothorax gibbosus]
MPMFALMHIVPESFGQEKAFSEKRNRRGELGGIESETFDFSQLEEYINDNNEGHIYFHDALVTSSDHLKLAEVAEKSPIFPRLGSEKDPIHLTAGGTECRGILAGGHHCGPQAAVDSHAAVPQHHQPKTYLARSGRTNSVDVSSSFAKPHHLPDSPPDSGSEPPFSPSNEGHKLKCPSLDLLPHLPPEMSHKGHPHHVFLHGSHDVSITSSTSPPSSSSSPHHHLRQHSSSSPVPVHSTHSASMPVLAASSVISGQLLSQIPQLTSFVGNPLQQQLMTPHLGHLYAGSEEFLYENLANPVSSTTNSKKRKLPDSPKAHRSSIQVKLEPSVPSPDPSTTMLPSSDEDYNFDLSAPEASALFVDSSFQCIRFQTFQQNTWAQLLDKDMKEIPHPHFRVDADKGFNFSNADESFVCQKKNHFQVTVHVQPVEGTEARYVRTLEGGTRPLLHFSLHFHGVKMESPTQTIKIEQSQSDRSKRPFHPVPLELVADQVTKTTVGRLHFSETTSNNMRKKGKPNPDQRFFFLVVSLCAYTQGEATPATVVAHSSEKIIVRASNPGQFENDMELSWQKGQTLDSIFHNGRVGINTDRPEESLVVHGNIKVTGHILQPSDFRAKYDIHELDPREQLRNVSNLRIVRYRYLPEFGEQVGLQPHLVDTGVIAQEVRTVIPEAVSEAGDVRLKDGSIIEQLLVVNKERIFMENVGAVKELCRVTNNLENRIGQLEIINKKLTRIKRNDSLKSTNSSLKSGQRCRRSCRQMHARKVESCSSHFLQSSIVTLVVIMACCIMAMAAIWILQWQTHLSHMRGTILILKSPSPWNATTPMTERSQMLSTLFPSLTMSSSYTQLSSTRTKTTQGDRHRVTPKHSGKSSDPKPPFPDEGLYDEFSDCSSSDECPVFCCDEQFNEEEAMDAEEDIFRHHVEKKSGERTGAAVISKKGVPSNSAIPKDEPSDKNFVEAGRVSPTPSIIKKRMIETEDEGGENSHAFRTDSEGVLLHLLELNSTLILDQNCIEQKGEESTSFRCSVNVSRHFPHANLTLHFSTEDSDAVIEFCGGSHYLSCPKEAPRSEKSANTIEKREAIPRRHTWQLPVGSFIRSRYRFRMMSPHLAAGQQICSQNMNFRPFTEFVLTFRRRCDK